MNRSWLNGATKLLWACSFFMCIAALLLFVLKSGPCAKAGDTGPACRSSQYTAAGDGKGTIWLQEDDKKTLWEYDSQRSIWAVVGKTPSPGFLYYDRKYQTLFCFANDGVCYQWNPSSHAWDKSQHQPQK